MKYIRPKFTLRKITIYISSPRFHHRRRHPLYSPLYLSNHLVCFKTSTNLLSDLSSNIIIHRDVRLERSYMYVYKFAAVHDIVRRLRPPNSHEDGEGFPNSTSSCSLPAVFSPPLALSFSSIQAYFMGALRLAMYMLLHCTRAAMCLRA